MGKSIGKCGVLAVVVAFMLVSAGCNHQGQTPNSESANVQTQSPAAADRQSGAGKWAKPAGAAA